MTETQYQLKKLTRQRIWLHIFGIPTTIMLGVGMYGYFTDDGQIFHPWLADPQHCLALVIAGGILSVYEMLMAIKINKKMVKLNAQSEAS